MSQRILRARVRHRRKLLGWSQSCLANNASVRRSKISEWESGLVELHQDESNRVESVISKGLRQKQSELASEVSITT